MANKYVASNGDDTYDGTSPVYVSGTTGPWATLHHAAPLLSAGDILYLVMHTDGASITSGGNTDEVALSSAGSRTAPITIVGANAAGEIDGTLGVFDATGITEANNDAFNIRAPYYVFRNIKVEGNGLAPASGFEFFSGLWTGTGPLGQSVFINCWVDNVAVTGFILNGGPSQICFVNCLSTNNGGFGFETANTVEGLAAGVAYNCVASGNGSDGFKNFALTINCIALNNNSTNDEAGFYGHGGMVINCTSYANACKGIHFDDESGMAINCLLLDNGDSKTSAYGIDIDDASTRSHAIINNGFWSNEDGETNNIRLAIGSTSLTSDVTISTSNMNLDRRKGAFENAINTAYPIEWEELGLESPSDRGAMMFPKPANIRVS